MDDIPPKEENVVVEVEPDYDNHNGVFNFILAFNSITFIFKNSYNKLVIQ